MIGNRRHNRILTYMAWLIVVDCLFWGTPLLAETEAREKEAGIDSSPGYKIEFNLGLSLLNLPEEGDFSGHEFPFELFLDYDLSQWIRFRIGFNSSKAKFDFDSWVSDGQKTDSVTIHNRLISRSVYLAYRYQIGWFKPLDLFAYGGITYCRSALEIDYGLSNTKREDSSSGFLLGVGGKYSFKYFGVGGQYQYQTSEADFGDASFKIGSNQLQVFMFYEF